MAGECRRVHTTMHAALSAIILSVSIAMYVIESTKSIHIPCQTKKKPEPNQNTKEEHGDIYRRRPGIYKQNQFPTKNNPCSQTGCLVDDEIDVRHRYRPIRFDSFAPANDQPGVDPVRNEERKCENRNAKFRRVSIIVHYTCQPRQIHYLKAAMSGDPARVPPDGPSGDAGRW
jgi:hypothetical protein